LPTDGVCFILSPLCTRFPTADNVRGTPGEGSFCYQREHVVACTIMVVLCTVFTMVRLASDCLGWPRIASVCLGMPLFCLCFASVLPLFASDSLGLPRIASSGRVHETDARALWNPDGGGSDEDAEVPYARAEKLAQARHRPRREERAASCAHQQLWEQCTANPSPCRHAADGQCCGAGLSACRSASRSAGRSVERERSAGRSGRRCLKKCDFMNFGVLATVPAVPPFSCNTVVLAPC